MIFILITFLFLLMGQILTIIYTNKTSTNLVKLLSNLKEFEKMNQNDSVGTHSLAPYFELINKQGILKKFPELISDRPLILLIVNTGCGVCSTDVEDFAKESIYYSQYYNFVLITNEISSQYDLNLEHKFNEILIVDEQFLSDYQIQRYPTFILINTFGQIVATPAFTHQFKNYYDPSHVQIVEG